MTRPKVEPIHREIAQALLDTFRPRLDVYAERFDDDAHVARVNAWMKDRGAKGFLLGDWKPAGKKGARKALTVDVLAEHVAGVRTLGFYPLHPDGQVGSVSVDFDNHRGAQRVERDPREDLDALILVCQRHGVRFLANHSRGGYGYWLHLLPPPGTQSREARAVLSALVREAGVKTIAEGGTLDTLFPKQDTVWARGGDPTNAPGNLFCVPVCARWMRAQAPGTHFLHTPPGELAAQLKHLTEYA